MIKPASYVQVSSMLLGEVERVLGEHGVNRRGDDVVLVACSGGIDSVVLAHATVEILGARRVVLGHVDHATRESSREDAKFVADFSRQLGVEHLIMRLTPGVASEERLRELRYRALESAQKSSGARFLLTAHTEDDQAETVLIALIRSTQLDALGGIPRQRGSILRPLLDVPREEVRRYAIARALAHVEDPTNREPEYLRNRVRKELLPLLERRYRPGIARRLARLAAEVRRERESKSAAAIDAAVPHVPRPAIRFERRTWTGGPLPEDPSSAIFDADVLETPVVRGARPGDRIEPLGMCGHRKLRDVLREAQVPAAERDDFPVVARADGAVVWVPGAARSGDAPVGPLTRSVWVFWMSTEARPEGGVIQEDHDADGAAQLQVASERVTLDPKPRARQEDE
jgi:tRNA(Ile)-lysidine synthetase-like protein